MKNLQKQARESVHDISLTSRTASNEQPLNTLKRLPQRHLHKRVPVLEKNVNRYALLLPKQETHTSELNMKDIQAIIEVQNCDVSCNTTSNANILEDQSMEEDSLHDLERALRETLRAKKTQYKWIKEKLRQNPTALSAQHRNKLESLSVEEAEDFLWMNDHSLTDKARIPDSLDANKRVTGMKRFLEHTAVKTQSFGI